MLEKINERHLLRSNLFMTANLRLLLDVQSAPHRLLCTQSIFVTEVGDRAGTLFSGGSCFVECAENRSIVHAQSAARSKLPVSIVSNDQRAAIEHVYH